MAILLILVLMRVAYAVVKIYLDSERHISKSIKESANEIKTFLGFDFGNDFSIIEYAVFNTYPDRPTRMLLQFKRSAFERIMEFVCMQSTGDSSTLGNYFESVK